MLSLLLLFCLKKMNWLLYLSHERCCCPHLPYLAGWLGDCDASWQSGLLLFSSLAGGGGSFFSSSGGGGGAAKTALTLPVSRSFLC
jgi:hypothetical protein